MDHSRILVPLAMLIACAIRLGAVDADQASHDLSHGWKFRLGDHVSWSDPTLDDGKWRSIPVGSPWEEEGSPEQDGYAWYRLHFRIPSQMREHGDYQRHGRLKLTLGKIDDVDHTWLNGELIGATGGFPEQYSTSWSTLRVYLAPSRLIRGGADNVLVVRVADGTDQGGMREGPYRVEPASASDLIKVAFDFGGADGIYLSEKPIPVLVTLASGAPLDVEGEVTWRVETDEGVELLRETTSRKLAAEGERALECPFTPSIPGFYRISCTFRDGGGERIQLPAERVICYRPEKVQAPLTKEDDFDDFWRQTLDRLADVLPEFALTRQQQFDSPTHEVYEVTMRSLGGVRVGGGMRSRNREERTQGILLCSVCLVTARACVPPVAVIPLRSSLSMFAAMGTVRPMSAACLRTFGFEDSTTRRVTTTKARMPIVCVPLISWPRDLRSIGDGSPSQAAARAEV